MSNICIIGGGVAGSTVALQLSLLGLNVELFDKKESIISGPPFCHLHAGGNLYREIPDEECFTLLRQSIDFLKYYPYAIDYRPTIITIPTNDDGDPLELIHRLKKLQNYYKELIKTNSSNKVLGEIDEYYQVISKEDILNSSNKWLKTFKDNIDLNKIKFPIFMVQEYGINMFRLASGITLNLQSLKNCNVHTNTEITKITKNRNQFNVTYRKDGISKTKEFDFIVNAAGFRSGTIDDMLNFKQDRFVEFKAAYVTKWSKGSNDWPEIIFHGKRGTPQGMAQFTPYPNGYFQLHGMTKHITLFKDGLVQSSNSSAQPKLHNDYLNKIEKNWEASEVEERTTMAIKHLAQYIPSFNNATIASKPLYGAQQIPGGNADLRAADISFEGDRYARCEIVKASSVLDMSDAIIEQLIDLNYLQKKNYKFRAYTHLNKLTENQINELSSSITINREYPLELSKLSIPRTQL